jgi:hypothetical protein
MPSAPLAPIAEDFPSSPEKMMKDPEVEIK